MDQELCRRNRRRRWRWDSSCRCGDRLCPFKTAATIEDKHDEDNDVEDVFVFETDVVVADGVEYVTDPVVGRYMIGIVLAAAAIAFVLLKRRRLSKINKLNPADSEPSRRQPPG
jgi:hypothetical protein